MDQKAQNAMEKLLALRGARKGDYRNPHLDIIRITRSPSVNFAFGNGDGLPAGYSLLLYGGRKGGKSLMCYDTVGALHEDDPEAVAMKWDTEMREELQGTPETLAMFKIDPARYIPYSTNHAEDIFDRFEKDVVLAIKAGVKIRLAIIDSTSNIVGRRQAKMTSVNQFDIGDHAQTLQNGLRFVLPVIREYKIGLILVTHIRAQMDESAQKRGEKVKPQAANAVQHFAEYFGHVERNEWKAGRVGPDGETAMINKAVHDVRGEGGEQFAHRIDFTMKETSAGVRGRHAQFTFDYQRGIINVHEEVLKLAHARGLIQTRGSNYIYNDTKWKGWDAALEALRDSPQLQAEIVAELRRRDLNHEWGFDETRPDDDTPDIGEIADSQPV